MRILMALLHHMFVRGNEDAFDNHLEARALAHWCVRFARIVGLDRGERGRNDLATEAEHRFVVCTTRRCNLSRLGSL